jgi:MerR family transcriptional regulator, light-induced transcriptional regulator
MKQAANALSIQVPTHLDVRQFEKHFISPEIYQRHDVAVRRSDIARFISVDIIPRLLRLHQEVLPEAPPVEEIIEGLMPDSADISALADILLGDDVGAAAAYVTVLRDRGLAMETLYIELLEPTARCLGTMWEEDKCDFIDVTIGVARLQHLLAIFNETYALPELGSRRHVLMATTPGNQHMLGVTMIERLLNAGGWQVETEYSGFAEKIVDAVELDWFAVIGLTAGSDRQLDGLKSVISDVRAASKNNAIGIMVGGPMFTANPALAKEVGADITAPNAPAAVIAAQKLFDRGVRARVFANVG